METLRDAGLRSWFERNAIVTAIRKSIMHHEPTLDDLALASAYLACQMVDRAGNTATAQAFGMLLVSATNDLVDLASRTSKPTDDKAVDPDPHTAEEHAEHDAESRSNAARKRESDPPQFDGVLPVVQPPVPTDPGQTGYDLLLSDLDKMEKPQAKHVGWFGTPPKGAKSKGK